MYSYWPALNTFNTYASRAAKHEQGITTVFLSDQHNHATKYGLPLNMCLHVCILIHIYSQDANMSTELSSSMHSHYVLYKRTEKYVQGGLGRNICTSILIYNCIYVCILYIYDLPLNFSRKHCVNTYTHTHFEQFPRGPQDSVRLCCLLSPVNRTPTST